MPFYLTKVYDNGVRLAVWKLTESVEELMQGSVLAFDLEVLQQKFRVEAKLKEYIAGKIALVEALAIFDIPSSEISKDEHGKPFLINSTWQMSISHTLDFIVVAFHPFLPIGVDIEKPSEKMRRIMPRLFSVEENKLVGDDVIKMSWFWSAKEALYKLYGKRQVDFKKHLKLYCVDNQLVGEIEIDDYFSVHNLIIEPIEAYYLVVAN